MSADLWEAFGHASIENTVTGNTSATTQVFQRPRPLLHDADHHLPNGDAHSLWQKDQEGNDVLFDASDDDLDDFGDFEVPSSRGQRPLSIDNAPSNPRHSVDLLGIEGLSVEQDTSVKQTSSSDGQPRQPAINLVADPENDWGDFENTVSTEVNLLPSAEVARKSTFVQPRLDEDTCIIDEEQWDNFDDGPPQAVNQAGARANIAADVQNTKPPSDRPTNIPPPFTLLQLFPQTVRHLASDTKLKSDASPSEMTVAGQHILQLYRTISRVIAGRASRWKRDTVLAQSMRISFAGNKNSGMKLQSLDRGESVKEDQEVLEVVSAWSRHGHSLNSTLARAKLKRPAMSLSADMKTRVANGPGILTSRESCAICGLRRNERVLGIDVNIDDVFGEFWVEHWGHQDCLTWWEENKQFLKQR